MRRKSRRARAKPDTWQRGPLRPARRPRTARTAAASRSTMQSRVAPYYGESILAQARQVLDALGVKHARVAIHDEGALPFVICRPHRNCGPPRRPGLTRKASSRTRSRCPQPSSRDRLRRSRLYLPGSEPKYFINAALHGPDAIILDLEDSVHHAEKDAARILVRNTLRAVDFGACERMVRINQLPLGLEDLAEIVPESPDLILIPKTETSRTGHRSRPHDRRTQRPSRHHRPIWLMPILESALGIENAFAIATASENVVALTIGLEDYTADLGVARTREGRESLYARTRLVNAAKAAGVQAIDSVFGDVADMDGLRRWGEESRALGFEGMGCIHPGQIPVIHAAFAPSPGRDRKSVEDCRCLRRRAAARLGRGQPGIEDDRSAGRAAGLETGGAGQANGTMKLMLPAETFNHQGHEGAKEFLRDPWCPSTGISWSK